MRDHKTCSSSSCDVGTNWVIQQDLLSVIAGFSGHNMVQNEVPGACYLEQACQRVTRNADLYARSLLNDPSMVPSKMLT